MTGSRKPVFAVAHLYFKGTVDLKNTPQKSAASVEWHL